MNIQWNSVTWYSKLLAVVLFVGVFWLGFYFGGLFNESRSIDTDVAGILEKGAAAIPASRDDQKYETSSSTPHDNVGSGQATYSWPSITITSPARGENLCLGEKSMIAWQVSGDVESIEISLVTDGSLTRFYRIDVVPPTYNETGEKGAGAYPWVVGESKSGRLAGTDAGPYKFFFEARIRQQNGSVTARFESPAFWIKDCRG